MIYTGIGSRETPEDILDIMRTIGYGMALRGHKLYSGSAPGADSAFEMGATKYARANPDVDISKIMTIFTPYEGFSVDNWKSYLARVYPIHSQYIDEEVESVCPWFHKMALTSKVFHRRNGNQILGYTDLPITNLVVYWAPHTKNGEPTGGTRTAVMLARKHGIPCIDMTKPDWNIGFKRIVDGWSKI